MFKGKVGVGGVYDFWRSLTGRITGRRAHLGHRESIETNGEAGLK
jgi:hypothetical protein